ncbi:MAG TPA: sulfotransferase [Candidatus Nitrosotalea sp.]|nr:sulfotransferase [Candidatus Nitrosotalea sp.]
MSTAVVVVGMHRSGTSALARGLKALSVNLGENFFDLQPDNPTGYWEDRSVVALNQRVLEELNLKWDDTHLISSDRLRHYRVRLVQYKAAYYLKGAFNGCALWGFKDPRTIRLLPFWRETLRRCEADDRYLVAIRHPRSVAASLFRRQQIPLEKAQRLWLVHNVPFLHELRDRPFVVVDYDLLSASPHEQLERIARALDLPFDAAILAQIDAFAGDFLDAGLRHNVFASDDFDRTTGAGRLARTAYLALHDLATGRSQPAADFWSSWMAIQEELEALPGTSA